MKDLLKSVFLSKVSHVKSYALIVLVSASALALMLASFNVNSSVSYVYPYPVGHLLINRKVISGKVLGTSTASFSLNGPFTFSATAGGNTPATQSLTITNKSGTTLDWTASTNQSWCYVGNTNSTGGTTLPNKPASTSLTVAAPSNVGTFTCTITVNANGSTLTTTATYTVALGAGIFPLTVTVTGSSPLTLNYQPSPTSAQSPALFTLKPGSIFTASALTTGTSVSGQNQWWIVRSSKGGPSLYAWAGDTDIGSFKPPVVSSPDPLYYTAALNAINISTATAQTYVSVGQQEGLIVNQYSDEDGNPEVELLDPFTSQLAASYHLNADLTPPTSSSTAYKNGSNGIVEAFASVVGYPYKDPGVCSTPTGGSVTVRSDGSVAGIGNYNVGILATSATFTYNGTTYEVQPYLQTAYDKAVTDLNSAGDYSVEGVYRGIITETALVASTNTIYPGAIQVIYDTTPPQSLANQGPVAVTITGEQVATTAWFGSNVVKNLNAIQKYLNNNIPLTSTQILNIFVFTAEHEILHALGIDHSANTLFMTETATAKSLVPLTILGDPADLALLKAIYSSSVSIISSSCVADRLNPVQAKLTAPPGLDDVYHSMSLGPVYNNPSSPLPTVLSDPAPPAGCTDQYGCLTPDTNEVMCGPGIGTCPTPNPSTCVNDNGTVTECDPASISSGGAGGGGDITCYTSDTDCNPDSY